MDEPKPQTKKEVKPREPTWLQTTFSVLASMFGVQTEANRKRDFSGGNPMKFIAMAIVLTVAFVLSLLLIVKLMLANAGV